MKYLLFICVEESAGARFTPEDGEKMRHDTIAWVEEAEKRGARKQGHRLYPVASAKTVRVRSSKPSVIDGPFAETKEQIAGFDILECASMEEAVEIASRHPVARIGAVEVRPFWPEET